MSAAANETRRHHRKRSAIRGRICHGRGFTLQVDCVIRNETSEGALLVVPPGGEVPARFVLLHVAKSMALEAEVVWRATERVGVRFGGQTSLAGEAPGPLLPLKRVLVELQPR